MRNLVSFKNQVSLLIKRRSFIKTELQTTEFLILFISVVKLQEYPRLKMA